MFEQILSVFFGDSDDSDEMTGDARLAVAALMVEAATIDGTFDEQERRLIRSLLKDRYGAGEDMLDRLLEKAIRFQQESNQLFPLTKTIVDRFSLAQRAELLETLWEVVYADGRLHDYESNLVRRIAGLLYVPDQESGAARQKAMARLGIQQPPHV